MPEFTAEGRLHRDVVSFVRRGSRMTAGQADAWRTYADDYVVKLPRGVRDTLVAEGTRLNVSEVFAEPGPLVVEIGSGQGDSIVSAAASRPEENFLAFEVYKPGLAQTLVHAERLGLPRNLRLLDLDAQHTVTDLLDPDSVSELWIFFADPWHKSKHHKRRLVSAPFLRSLVPLLRPGGVIRTATDWAHYAHHQALAFAELEANGLLVNMYPAGQPPTGTTSDEVPESMPLRGWAPRFDGRVRTAFEAKAHAAGRLVWELAYRRP